MSDMSFYDGKDLFGEGRYSEALESFLAAEGASVEERGKSTPAIAINIARCRARLGFPPAEVEGAYIEVLSLIGNSANPQAFDHLRREAIRALGEDASETSFENWVLYKAKDLLDGKGQFNGYVDGPNTSCHITALPTGEIDIVFVNPYANDPTRGPETLQFTLDQTGTVTASTCYSPSDRSRKELRTPLNSELERFLNSATPLR